MNIFTQQPRGKMGFGIFFIFILILFLIFIVNQGYILASQCSEDDNFVECVFDVLLGEDEDSAPAEGSVVATGSISGEYGGDTRSVSVSMTIPLEGGEVSGNFSGDCDGTIRGTYAGGNGGAISGTGSGSCGFVFPASGSFSGSVNTASKTIPIQGKGKAAGIEGEASITLTY